MAFAAYLDAVQKIYIAFYQRPADPAGLRYWAQRMDAAGGDQAAVIDAFASSPEAVALYGEINGTTIGAVIDKIYMALFNRAPDEAGKKFYVDGFNAGTFTAGSITLAVLGGAQNDDAVAVSNKLGVANEFTKQVDGREMTNPDFGTGSFFNATYAGDADAVAARDILKAVTSSPSTVLNASQVTEALQTKIADAGDAILTITGGDTFTLTTGIDNIVGTAGNDTINASWNTAATKTLGGLDIIDGGAGTDTLNVDDSATASGALFSTGGATVKNVEVIKIATTGQLGDKSATTALDLSGMTGATTVDLKSQDAGAVDHSIKVADTADLAVTAAAGTVDTVGGKVVSVTAPGVVLVKGDALTNVTVKGAATASDVTNTVNGAGAAGTTLTSVTFDGIATGVATAKGDALNAVTIKNQAVALATTLTNTATAALTVNVENAGYNTTTKALVPGVSVDASTSANYKTVTVNSTGVNQLTLTAADATSIKATGAGNVTLTLAAAAATAFDGSAATGDIALSGFATTMTDIKTGAGKDSFTTNQTTKSAFDTGAGNDTVTVGSALAAGTTVKLGAGDDKLLFSAGGSVANSTATAITLVDGGDGSDTLALELVGAANIGVFKNFEVFDVVGMTAKTLDLDILATNNTVTGLTGSGTTTGAVTLTNVGAGVGFTAVKNMVAAGTVAVKTAPVPVATEVVTLTQKTAGALTVKVDSDSTSTTTANDAATSVVATNATSLKAEFASDSGFVQTVGAVATENNQAIILEGSKAVSLEVVSGGTNATNLLSYTIGAGAVATDGVLTSATVNGSQALTLDFALKGGVTTNKLATVDASALTGSLTFDLGDLANAGTLKLGSGADVVKAGGVITTSADIESVQNFTKAASKDAAAVKVADILDFTAAATVGVEATPANAVIDVAKGVVTFLGTGPTTLDQAIQMISTDVTVAGSAVAFQYLNDTYVVQVGATAGAITDDVVVKLVGVTGVTELAVDASANVYLV